MKGSLFRGLLLLAVLLCHTSTALAHGDEPHDTDPSRMPDQALEKDMVFIPAEEKHRLRATTPLFYFEFQAPNRFQTMILEGTGDDLKWEHRDGKVWMQS